MLWYAVRVHTVYFVVCILHVTYQLYSTIYNRIVNSMLCWLNADAAVLPAISGCSWRTMIVTRFLLGTR